MLTTPDNINYGSQSPANKTTQFSAWLHENLVHFMGTIKKTKIRQCQKPATHRIHTNLILMAP